MAPHPLSLAVSCFSTGEPPGSLESAENDVVALGPLWLDAWGRGGSWGGDDCLGDCAAREESRAAKAKWREIIINSGLRGYYGAERARASSVRLLRREIESLGFCVFFYPVEGASSVGIVLGDKES